MTGNKLDKYIERGMGMVLVGMGFIVITFSLIIISMFLFGGFSCE